MKKLKVFWRCPANSDCGVGFYRNFLPLMELERQGYIETRIKHFTYGKLQDIEQNRIIDYPEAEATADMAWADLTIWERNDTPTYIAYMAMCTDYFKKPAIVSYDDSVWATRPVNPGYRSFHPGSEYLKWNLEACKYVTGMMVSTQFLQNEYKDRVKNIYVLPNSLDMEERDKVNSMDLSAVPLYQKKPGEFRIIWSGSASHWENLNLMLAAVKDIMVKYPNVTFVYTGLFGGLTDTWPEDVKKRVQTVPFVDLRAYGRMLREMHGDIAIAPLTDCNFNRAKSNLRVLEYGSVKYPVIASDVLPYQCFTKDEVVLVKPEEWYHAIEALMLDPKRQKALVRNLYKRVKKDFNVKKNSKLWLKMFREQLALMK